MSDYLFRGPISEYDSQLQELLDLESERQFRRLILIPSESTSPLSVRAALDSAFHNIYAEGYPPEGWRRLDEAQILDYEARLGEYRRLGDPRYYKGVEYADILESLARRRAAELFAANGLQPEDLYVNVQALSGGPANNAVYHALVEPGDTVMGMDLVYGGHLSHGSPVNRSGKYYNIVPYSIDPETERIDYETMRKLARAHKPKLIIGGYSSYPWQADWQAYRDIADEVGAYLLADISHVAGLIAGGVYPSPVGIADVITTTTHKTLCGPRGALIITHKRLLAGRLDRAVFPGEQGGPHVNVFAALALALRLAASDQFRKLQEQIIRNAAALTSRLSERGFKIPFGGTNTHLSNLDCKSVRGPDGTPLSGDYAARILDLAGIVVNRNTIPGDASALNPTGIRLGTPWITQRGFKEDDCIELADIMADLLLVCTPYQDPTARRRGSRAKVDFERLREARKKVAALAEKSAADFKPGNHGYPHFPHRENIPGDVMEWAVFELAGDKMRQFANFTLSCDVEGLQPGVSRHTTLHAGGQEIPAVAAIGKKGTILLRVASRHANLAGAWLRDLSDGYLAFDDDLARKIPGPVRVRNAGHGIGPSEKVPDPTSKEKGSDPEKPYFIGIDSPAKHAARPALPAFEWQPPESDGLRTTPLHALHLDLGARMVPFAGWEMPVWYASVKEEHAAVREAAGLFDVTHMGVYQAEGPEACTFLDSVCGNDISALEVGESCYTHFLDPHANVLDDLLVYRRGPEKYLLVVNAANDDKDWDWLNRVRTGQVLVDPLRPWTRSFGRNVLLRNLRDPQEGADRLVDIALQGPRSRDILAALAGNSPDRDRIQRLGRSQLDEVQLAGIDLVISRTGYTGEPMGFELFVHPENAMPLWLTLLERGGKMGLQPCGLGARDSLRTEAGLPLYGNEMGGSLGLGVGEAGFGSYVKAYKPWFIGRDAFLERERQRKGEVVRFSFEEHNVRMAHLGDPVLDRRGRTIGVVTSCAIDKLGYLTGQAFVDSKYTDVDTPLLIFQGASNTAGKAPAELRFGDRVVVPTPAKVVRRFPRL